MQCLIGSFSVVIGDRVGQNSLYLYRTLLHKGSEGIYSTMIQKTNKSRSRNRKGCCVARLIVLNLLNIPCLIYATLHWLILSLVTLPMRKKRKLCRKNCSLFAREWFESRVQYDDVLWPMMDVDCEDSRVLYQARVRRLLSQCQSQDSCQSSQGKRKLKLEVDLLCGASFPSRYDVMLSTCKELPLHTRQGIASMVLVRAMVNDNPDYVQKSVRISGYDCVSAVTADGLTTLHYAVLNGKSLIIQIILELLSPAERYELLHISAADNALLPECLGSARVGLHLAVRMGDIESTRILVSQGAELSHVDEDGHNVFHLCAFLAAEEETMAVKMLSTLIRLIPTWIEHTRQYGYLREMPSQPAQLVAKIILLTDHRDKKYFQTPLKLAARIGSRPLVEAILNVEGVYVFPCLSQCESMYDMTEICPVLNSETDRHCGSLSVLELLTTDSSDRSLDCLDIPLLAQSLDLKLRAHTPHIVFFSAVHLILMTLFSLNVNTSEELDYSSSNHTQNTTMVDVPAWYRLSHIEYAVGACCLFYINYSVGYVAAVVRLARLRHLSPAGLYRLLSTHQVSTLLVFPLLTITYLILKAVNSPIQVYVLSAAFLAGWFQVLVCTRAFKATAFFSIMIYRVLVGDIARFLLVIAFMVVAFSTSAGVIIQVLDTGQGYNSSSPAVVMLDHFKLATGVADYSRLNHIEGGSTLEIFKIIIYICFIVLANVLMFNLLIAAMSDRYSQISHLSRLLCLKVQAADMLVLERMLPPCLRNKTLNLYTQEALAVKLPDGSHMRREVHLLKVSLRQ